MVEDSFRIVIKDVNGKFHSFQKSDLRVFEKQPGKSVMPSFKDKLSNTQVDDLVAYLAGLKGTNENRQVRPGSICPSCLQRGAVSCAKRALRTDSPTPQASHRAG